MSENKTKLIIIIEKMMRLTAKTVNYYNLFNNSNNNYYYYYCDYQFLISQEWQKHKLIKACSKEKKYQVL